MRERWRFPSLKQRGEGTTHPGQRATPWNWPLMACESEHRPLGVFECQLCALTAPYSYVGQKPPNTQSVILLEESYVMKDPFTSDKDRFLILGSRCSVCSRLVCVGPECSLFYSKRFCLPCVQENIAAFPQEIRQDLQKRKVPPKRPAAQPSSRA
ncbi:cysteine-rich DPF motif domain-containing protein 1 isoform X2 [Pteropus medius]|uniref:cysteine-rich DPF motif domain-containing protein 1 isoform X2 n=1 Tax=Pteropus vampyrus TaxID=132908 RepID=UPI00196ADD45|nr:cysteine-rich DPF motif domain-containing protein 1 isoform X2 [Pteropus giganteus]